jgi:hypothetical protein
MVKKRELRSKKKRQKGGFAYNQFSYIKNLLEDEKNIVLNAMKNNTTRQYEMEDTLILNTILVLLSIIGFIETINENIPPDVKDASLYKLSSKTLLGNSANCMFTRLNVSTASYKQDYFLKFQVNPDADNILIDNIIGYILSNSITESPVFTKYVDCFNTYVQKSQYGHVFDIDDILSSPNGSIQYDKYQHHTFKVCKVNVQEQIKGVSLYSVIKDKGIPPELYSSLNELCESLKIYGRWYGFVHNDIHLDNILYDKKCTLIDYGRVSFDWDKFFDYENESIRKGMTEIFKKSGEYLLTKNVKEVLDNLRGKYSYSYVKPTVMSYMFDISTIAMNLLYEMPHEALKAFCHETGVVVYFKDRSKKRIIASPSTLVLYRIKLIETQDQFKGLRTKLFILKGLYWFLRYSNMPTTYKEFDLVIDVNSKVRLVMVNFQKLVMDRDMYWCFQYLNADLEGKDKSLVKSYELLDGTVANFESFENVVIKQYNQYINQNSLDIINYFDNYKKVNPKSGGSPFIGSQHATMNHSTMFAFVKEIENIIGKDKDDIVIQLANVKIELQEAYNVLFNIQNINDGVPDVWYQTDSDLLEAIKTVETSLDGIIKSYTEESIDGLYKNVDRLRQVIKQISANVAAMKQEGGGDTVGIYMPSSINPPKIPETKHKNTTTPIELIREAAMKAMQAIKAKDSDSYAAYVEDVLRERAYVSSIKSEKKDDQKRGDEEFEIDMLRSANSKK